MPTDPSPVDTAKALLKVEKQIAKVEAILAKLRAAREELLDLLAQVKR